MMKMMKKAIIGMNKIWLSLDFGFGLMLMYWMRV